MDKLIPGTVYEVRPRFRYFINGDGPPEAWFMIFIGYSSKSKPVFQNGDKFNEYDTHPDNMFGYDILPLNDRPA